MASAGWRLGMWARRMIPQTPAKRWAYGFGLLLALLPMGVARSSWSLAMISLVLAVRVVEVAIRRRRERRMSTHRAYFFEGQDEDSGPPRR